MNLPKHFISCDWGTSNFRMRVVETQTLKVLEEVQTNMGIKTLNEQFLKEKTKSRHLYFGEYMVSQIQNLMPDHQQLLVVVSGMASSNIGLEDMPYADVPFGGSSTNLTWKKIVLPNGSDLLLISGVKTQNSMMRGEEIQAIGLEDKLRPYGSGVLLLPGTHCKHLGYQDGQFSTMKTFMTGELFELISTKSILSGSVVKQEFMDDLKTSFLNGVKSGLKNELSENLFSIRANTVLHEIPKDQNYYYLSGLLIGNEIAYLQTSTENIFLCAAEPVFSLYKMALVTFVATHKLILFDASYIQNALLNGQRKIINQYVL